MIVPMTRRQTGHKLRRAGAGCNRESSRVARAWRNGTAGRSPNSTLRVFRQSPAHGASLAESLAELLQTILSEIQSLYGIKEPTIVAEMMTSNQEAKELESCGGAVGSSRWSVETPRTEAGQRRAWRWVGVLALGLAFAVGFGLRGLPLFQPGSMAGTAGGGLPAWLTPAALQASSASQAESFAMATGAIDSDVEGCFMLDFLTGELQCVVLNYRTGRFGGFFRTNVIADLGSDPVKKPKYVMVAGAINFPRGAAAARPGHSVVYVLDTTTGNYAAYGLPWRRELAATGQGQMSGLVLMDVGRARTAALQR